MTELLESQWLKLFYNSIVELQGHMEEAASLVLLFFGFRNWEMRFRSHLSLQANYDDDDDEGEQSPQHLLDGSGVFIAQFQGLQRMQKMTTRMMKRKRMKRETTLQLRKYSAWTHTHTERANAMFGTQCVF